MPDESTVRDWAIKDIDGFSPHYTRARDKGLDSIADEIVDIADDGRNDWIERESQRTGQTYIALNEEAVARSKIRIDARKWLLSKLAPKKYGDKQVHEHTGADGAPLNNPAEQAQALATIFAAAAARKQIDDDLDGLV